MTFLLTVIETDSFLAAAMRLMSEQERAKVVDMVAANPEGGVLVRGTGGLRKLRIPLKGRGKRGGGRVIYWYHSEGYPAALLTVFAKSEAPDLTVTQQRGFAAIGAAVLAQLGVRR
jgi:hypothetical protein